MKVKLLFLCLFAMVNFYCTTAQDGGIGFNANAGVSARLNAAGTGANPRLASSSKADLSGEAINEVMYEIGCPERDYTCPVLRKRCRSRGDCSSDQLCCICGGHWHFCAGPGQLVNRTVQRSTIFDELENEAAMLVD